MKDLFGNEITLEEAREILRVFKRKRDETPKGYAARPGSGPAGETCRTCTHASHINGGANNYWKCAVIRHRWSGCYATDIRLKSPACSFWKPKPGAPASGTAQTKGDL